MNLQTFGLVLAILIFSFYSSLGFLNLRTLFRRGGTVYLSFWPCILWIISFAYIISYLLK
jgi:hypothetical protein